MRARSVLTLLVVPGILAAQDRAAGSAFPVTIPPKLLTGEVTGIAINAPRTKAWVVTRTAPRRGPSQLLEFTISNGTLNFSRELSGAMLAGAALHAVRVDPKGNPWVVDAAGNTVLKLDANGSVQMVLGRRVASPASPAFGLFSSPADVAFDDAGNVYVADGGNGRVVKFDSTGKYVAAVTIPGTGTARSHPHSIVIRRGRLYVADGEASRPELKVFGTDLKPLPSIPLEKLPANAVRLVDDVPDSGEPTSSRGAPWALCAAGNDTQFLFVADAFPGRIQKLSLDSAKVVASFGTSGRGPGQLGWIHALACPDDTTVYMADMLNWRAQILRFER